MKFKVGDKVKLSEKAKHKFGEGSLDFEFLDSQGTITEVKPISFVYPFLVKWDKYHRKSYLYNEDELELAKEQEGEAMSPKDKQVGGEHYKVLPIQPSEFIRKNKLGWYEGNAVKYICRHRLKGGSTDLEKAIHYLELALEEYNNPEPVEYQKVNHE